MDEWFSESLFSENKLYTKDNAFVKYYLNGGDVLLSAYEKRA